MTFAGEADGLETNHHLDTPFTHPARSRMSRMIPRELPTLVDLSWEAVWEWGTSHYPALPRPKPGRWRAALHHLLAQSWQWQSLCALWEQGDDPQERRPGTPGGVAEQAPLYHQTLAGQAWWLTLPFDPAPPRFVWRRAGSQWQVGSVAWTSERGEGWDGITPLAYEWAVSSQARTILGAWCWAWEVVAEQRQREGQAHLLEYLRAAPPIAPARPWPRAGQHTQGKGRLTWGMAAPHTPVVLVQGERGVYGYIGGDVSQRGHDEIPLRQATLAALTAPSRQEPSMSEGLPALTQHLLGGAAGHLVWEEVRPGRFWLQARTLEGGRTWTLLYVACVAPGDTGAVIRYQATGWQVLAKFATVWQQPCAMLLAHPSRDTVLLVAVTRHAHLAPIPWQQWHLSQAEEQNRATQLTQRAAWELVHSRRLPWLLPASLPAPDAVAWLYLQGRHQDAWLPAFGVQESVALEDQRGWELEIAPGSEEEATYRLLRPGRTVAAGRCRLPPSSLWHRQRARGQVALLVWPPASEPLTIATRLRVVD